MKSDVLVLFRPDMEGQCTPRQRDGQGSSRTNRGETAMTQFTAHTAESAPAASRPLLEGIGRSFGFVPNLFGVFAESPAALRGALAIYEAFSTSSLSPAEQQLVMLAVSEANDCEYCVAAHSTLAKRFAKVR